MSRSGYSEDCENLGLWRGAVSRAITGKRGQAFLRELAAALDAMPVKELVVEETVSDDDRVCTIGAVAIARGLDVSDLDESDQEEVGKRFGIARAMAAEIAYENDECGQYRYEGSKRIEETPAERWTRMRKWVADSILREAP